MERIPSPTTISYQGQQLAKKIGARYYVECSGKTGEGVREVFQIATREAFRPRPTPPPKRFDKFKVLLKSSSKNEEDVESEKAPQLDASEEQELKRLLAAAVAVAPLPLEKFRLLIIGKTGCGKTTILYKVSILNQLLHVMKPVNFRSVPGMWREYGKSDQALARSRFHSYLRWTRLAPR